MTRSEAAVTAWLCPSNLLLVFNLENEECLLVSGKWGYGPQNTWMKAWSASMAEDLAWWMMVTGRWRGAMSCSEHTTRREAPGTGPVHLGGVCGATGYGRYCTYG